MLNILLYYLSLFIQVTFATSYSLANDKVINVEVGEEIRCVLTEAISVLSPTIVLPGIGLT